MLWVLVIGLIAFLVFITVVENRRGSKAPFKGQDRHLHAPEKRGAPGVEGFGGGSGTG